MKEIKFIKKIKWVADIPDYGFDVEITQHSFLNDYKGLDIKIDEKTSGKLIYFPNQQNTSITFSSLVNNRDYKTIMTIDTISKEITMRDVKITKNGFYYKDQRIDDVAGVYKAMCAILKDYL